MDGDAVSGPQKRRKTTKRPRRTSGLEVIERNGFWHIHGTIHVAGRSRRIRKTTGLPATSANFFLGEEEAHRIESEIRGQILENRGPNHFVAVAAEQFLDHPRSRPLGRTSVLHIKKAVVKFGFRRLRDIDGEEWRSWIDQMQKGNKPQTRERFIGSIHSFLSYCAKEPRKWCEMPLFERDNKARNPRRRARRRVKELSVDLIAFMIMHAAPHLQAQLWTQWSTGARVSSILHGCRLCDLILAPGREQITFHNTKNGENVDAALHPLAVTALHEYLEWRGKLHDRKGPLFLTHRKVGYSQNSYGSQNKTAFNAMKRRAAQDLLDQASEQAEYLITQNRAGDATTVMAEAEASADLVSSITQHWFRHMLATKMLQNGDLAAAMKQGGWLDERSVMGYQIDVKDHRRSIVNQLHIDTHLTHDKKAHKNK